MPPIRLLLGRRIEQIYEGLLQDRKSKGTIVLPAELNELAQNVAIAALHGEDTFALAARYFVGVLQAEPFSVFNASAAWVIAFTFLLINESQLVHDDGGVTQMNHDLIEDVQFGDADTNTVAEYFRKIQFISSSHSFKTGGNFNMQKPLIKIGNSQGVIIDKTILDLLKIAEGSQFDISTDGRSIILTPTQDNDAVFEWAKTQAISRSKPLLNSLEKAGDGLSKARRAGTSKRAKASPA